MRELINETTLDLIEGLLTNEWWTSKYSEVEGLVSAIGEIKGAIDLRNELVSRLEKNKDTEKALDKMCHNMMDIYNNGVNANE